MSAHRISQKEIPMKHKKQFKRSMSMKAHIRGSHFYLHLSLPVHWLIILAAVIAAMATSTPVTQIMDVLTQLAK
jgi:flagellar motor component MotA